MDRRHHWLKRAPLAGGIVLALVFVGLLVWFIRGFMAMSVQKPERVIQNITVIRPPPPPPPEDKPPPPPPEKVDTPIAQKQAEPTPDNTPAPPQQQLGLDAAGGAGDDAFGLLARQGGTDIAGTGGAAFAWYTGKLTSAINDRLSADPKLHAKKFTVDIRVWIGPDGHISQVKLTGSSGSGDIDREIATALASIGRLSDAPPLEMPEPVSLQIVSRT